MIWGWIWWIIIIIYLSRVSTKAATMLFKRGPPMAATAGYIKYHQPIHTSTVSWLTHSGIRRIYNSYSHRPEKISVLHTKSYPPHNTCKQWPLCVNIVNVLGNDCKIDELVLFLKKKHGYDLIWIDSCLRHHLVSKKQGEETAKLFPWKLM